MIVNTFSPHSCKFIGEENIRDGDDRFINNVLIENALHEYEKQNSSNIIQGNVYVKPSLFNSKKPIYNLIQKDNEIERYLILIIHGTQLIDLYVVVKILVKQWLQSKDLIT